MSLQSLRDAIIDAKTSEIHAIEKSRSHRLRSLYILTKLVGGAALSHSAHHSASPSPTEQEFLDQNDLASGHLFREETLAYPTPPSSTTDLSLKSPSTTEVNAQSSTASSLSSDDAPAQIETVDAPDDRPTKATRNNLIVATPDNSLDTPPRSPHVAFDTSTKDDDVSTVTAVSQNGGDNQDRITEDGLSDKIDGRPTTSKRLSSRLVSPQDRKRTKDRNEGPFINTSQNDTASSPSSTAGANSASTPRPLPQSPDTSPEAETSLSNAGITNSRLQNVVDEHTAGELKQHNDNHTSPEAQLRLEEAQANQSQSSRTAQGDTPQRLSNGQPQDATVQTGLVDLRDAKSSISTSTAQDVEMVDSTAEIGLRSELSRQTSMKQNGFKVPALDLTPSRMTTRVASGAIRQKSVSEILGESPRRSPPSAPQPADEIDSLLPKLDTSALSREGSGKKKSSTVVFSKDIDIATTKALRNELEGYLMLKGASLDSEKDYLRPLFLHQAWSQPRAQPLGELISKAGKTITTADVQASIREVFEYKILRRIYNMQNTNKWSLRQMAKFQDPTPPKCHHDFMMDEMKWLRTDFREERRWKKQVARNMAMDCAAYLAASEEDKQKMRVRSRLPTRAKANAIDSSNELSSVPPLSTGSSISSEEDMQADLIISPAAIFSLGYQQVVFEMDKTASGDALLNELPLYDPNIEDSQTESALPLPSKNRLNPVSKYVNGKLIPRISGLPRKRSRYEYEQSDDEPLSTAQHTHKRNKSTDPSPFLSPARRSSPRAEIPPEEQEVALFNPINKHILDRLHATHAFRPPNEFPMPSIAYFEARPQSQWTWDEDQKLRHAVRKYTYNWSLIAMELQSQCQTSGFISGAERRTPWECFERWVQLEGLPPEMSKTAYFKAYQQRLETATRTIQAQALAAQQASVNGQTPTQAAFQRLRRTSHQPVRVERRRDSRHISMIDAMKKIAKRRENAAQRQADTAKAAELRKSSQTESSGARPSGTIHTPQELSRYKQEREAKARENAELMRQQQQKMALERQRVLQAGQAQAASMAQSNASVQNVNGQAQTARSVNNVANVAASQAQIAQAAAQVRLANGMQNGAMGGMGMSGLTPQQIHALQQSGRLSSQSNTAELARLAALQQQRQLAIQQQQQLAAQNPGLVAAHISPVTSQQHQIQQQQMMAAMQRANGMAVNGLAGASPHMANMNGVMGLTNSQQSALLQLQHNIHQQHPHLPAEQVRALAQERLKAQLRNMSQTALAAAAGANAGSNGIHNQALAQQHLGLHGHTNASMMAAFAAAQNSIGSMGSPSNAAAALAAQNLAMQNGMVGNKGLNGAGAISSPTQMYRNVNIHAAQQARLSGSPGMMPTRPDSRSGTPNGMVRSASGASASPTIGSNLGR